MAVTDYLKTEKQKTFDRDFLKDAPFCETWDEVEMGKVYEGEREFEITLEDIKAYNEAIEDDNPLFNDEEYARNAPYGNLIAHPLFCVPIAFWCIGKGPGSWIRSPGAVNPGQKIEFYEPFRPGEVISLKLESCDRWIKRGRHYLTYKSSYYNQDGRLKAIWYCTLILPPTREELIKYAKSVELAKEGNK